MFVSVVNNRKHSKSNIFFQATLDKNKGMGGEIKMQHEEKKSQKDNISLTFEKFVSTQTVSFFSQQMDISNLIISYDFFLSLPIKHSFS